ncbi:serine/threonine protein kinase [Myxococcus sp. K15C18031901]|uniref:serine/threonine protein kinase n=1 Tax=Myxococcus dinghuensis TaxID=2906761 RepID=UPI0020A80901|nr:serine/threonine-protein kinase [Myxococcus dinghuensis]MCP3102627.1 serine/threonine protein kinase [Myxococcus dinghuensis]
MSTAPTETSRFLGRYELVHPLGQGGMGEVFLAKISGAAGFEKPCIVKTILPSLLKDRQFLDRFHHEAKVLVHLVHSSIAQVYDMGEAEGTYYMALEYVAGVDLAYLLEQSRVQGVAVPVPVALFLGQRMAEGLGYAHRKAGPDGTPLGIVHRDVSPHNVMVSYEGEVKVIDFGLAKSAARSKYTLPSTVMGKLGYMSPEQVRAEPLDHRSDIYSCGVVVWEMLAGRSLIPHGTVGEMMAAMSSPTVPALGSLRPDVDASLDAVVHRALAIKPDERYGRADELARALNGELVRSGSAVGAEEVGQFVRSLCPEAFATQRELISKVTSSASHRRTPTPYVQPAAGTGTGMFGTGPQGPASQAPGADAPGSDATLMRQGGEAAPGKPRSGGIAPPAAAAGGFEPTMMRSGGDVAPGAPRSGGIAPGGFEPTMMRSGGDAAQGAQRSGGIAPSDAGTVGGFEPTMMRPGSEVASRSGGVAPVGAQGAGSGVAPAVPSHVAPVPTPRREEKKGSRTALVALCVLLLMAGTAAGTAYLMRGVGATAPGTPPVSGGTPTPTPPSEPPKQPAPPPVVADTPKPPEPTPPPEKPTEPDKVATKDPVTPKRPTTSKAPKPPVTKAAETASVTYVTPAASSVLPVLEDAGGVVVKGPLATHLEAGTVLQVVGPPNKGGQRVLLGTARVLPMAGGLGTRKAMRVLEVARVRLDEDALSAEGTLFAVVPASVVANSSEEEAPEAPPAETKPPPKRALQGVVLVATGLGHLSKRDVLVRNTDTINWTNCYVVKRLRQRGRLGDLPKGSERIVSSFAPWAEFLVGNNEVGVFCKEGELKAYLPNVR